MTRNRDTPMLVRCLAREGDGVRGYQCEALVVEQNDGHSHFISEKSIKFYLSRGSLPMPAYLYTDDNC